MPFKFLTNTKFYKTSLHTFGDIAGSSFSGHTEIKGLSFKRFFKLLCAFFNENMTVVKQNLSPFFRHKAKQLMILKCGILANIISLAVLFAMLFLYIFLGQKGMSP